MKLLIMAPNFNEYEAEIRAIVPDWQLVALKEKPEAELLYKEIRDADVIFGQPNYKELKEAKKLQWLQMQWAGVDCYAKAPYFPENVLLTNVSGAYGDVIGEHALALTLALARHLRKYGHQQDKAYWQDCGSEKFLSGSTALILGVGDLGSQCAKRFKALGLKTIGIATYQRLVPYFDEVYTMKELEELLTKADVVIGCLPDTALTRGLLNGTKLSLMKDDAILINVGRGSLIVEKDLEELLAKGKFWGVGLDVFEKEPLNPNSTLWQRDNVIITPHVAGIAFGHAKSAERAVYNIFMDNLKRFVAHEELKNIVDLKAGYAVKKHEGL